MKIKINILSFKLIVALCFLNSTLGFAASNNNINDHAYFSVSTDFLVMNCTNKFATTRYRNGKFRLEKLNDKLSDLLGIIEDITLTTKITDYDEFVDQSVEKKVNCSAIEKFDWRLTDFDGKNDDADIELMYYFEKEYLETRLEDASSSFNHLYLQILSNSQSENVCVREINKVLDTAERNSP